MTDHGPFATKEAADLKTDYLKSRGLKARSVKKKYISGSPTGRGATERTGWFAVSKQKKR